MLIVIEGSDLTGKTTLAEMLRKRAVRMNPVETQIWHAEKPKEHPISEYEGNLMNYRPLHGWNLILDRWHVGERVWPAIFGRESSYTDAMFRHTEMFLKSRGAVLVYAQRAVEKLAYDIDHADPPEPVRGDQLPEILGLFEFAMMQVHNVPMRYDYEDHPEEKARDIISEAFVREDACADIHRITSEWIGDPVPRVLLVGDQLGPETHGRRHAMVPFVPFPSTSGHFLMDELVATRWHEMAIVNRKAGWQEQRLRAIHQEMGFPPVIALGREADKELTRQGIGHETVPHPQYVRRFERKRGEGWLGGLIEDAVQSLVKEEACT